MNERINDTISFAKTGQQTSHSNYKYGTLRYFATYLRKRNTCRKIIKQKQLISSLVCLHGDYQSKSSFVGAPRKFINCSCISVT